MWFLAPEDCTSSELHYKGKPQRKGSRGNSEQSKLAALGEESRSSRRCLVGEETKERVSVECPGHRRRRALILAHMETGFVGALCGPGEACPSSGMGLSQ